MMRSTLSTLVNTTIGRVRRRTSTKQRSITLVVRSFRHRYLGKLKKGSKSGKSRSSCRTTLGWRDRVRRQVDLLRFALELFFVASFGFLKNIPHFVHLTPLVPDPRIDRF